MSKKNNMKSQIISAALGATFFAIPYLGLGISILPSLGIGIAAFGASNLMFSDSQKAEEKIDREKSFYNILSDAKKQNAQIYSLIQKVENKNLQEDIKELHSVAAKIIDTISKNPNKQNQAQSFFDYYLPVTLKILTKYDDIENQGLDNEEIKKFMTSTEKMILKIKNAFKNQLSNLYQSDIIDTDAEMKVFESMLNSEGFNDINDFNIK